MASVDVSPSISFHLFLQLAKILLGSCFSSWVVEDREGGEDAPEAKDCHPVFGTLQGRKSRRFELDVDLSQWSRPTAGTWGGRGMKNRFLIQFPHLEDPAQSSTITGEFRWPPESMQRCV